MDLPNDSWSCHQLVASIWPPNICATRTFERSSQCFRTHCLSSGAVTIYQAYLEVSLQLRSDICRLAQTRTSLRWRLRGRQPKMWQPKNDANIDCQRSCSLKVVCSFGFSPCFNGLFKFIHTMYHVMLQQRHQNTPSQAPARSPHFSCIGRILCGSTAEDTTRVTS